MNHGIHGTHGRRSWWRSRLFWVGVPGLVFLVWVWWIFPRRALDIDAGRMVFEVRAFPEALEFTMIEASWRPPEWEAEVFPIGEEDRVDREDPLLRWSRKYFPGMNEPIHYVSMRPWVPSAVYLGCWLGGVAGWCFWKGRRFNRGKVAVGASGR
jgi:hypothetical protein